MRFAIYNISDGIICRFVNCPPDHIEMQLSSNEEYYLNCGDQHTHIINNIPIAIDKVSDDVDLVRFKRDCLLQSSDWTQIPDAPLIIEKKKEWAAYRQQLRDFPDICDPENPVWPVAPN